MSLSLVFAAALMLSGQQATPQDGPIVTQQRAPTETAEALRTREAMAYAYPIPPGVPTDDYGFLGYCSGLIEGHIALGNTLGANADAELMRLAGLELRDFQGALRTGAARATPAQTAGSQAAHDAAMTRWQTYLANPDEAARQQAFDLFYGLPGRCEHAARRTRENITTPPVTLEQVGLTREEVVPESMLEAERAAAEAAAAPAQPAATGATPGTTPTTTAPSTTAPATPSTTAPATTAPATPRPTPTPPTAGAPATTAPATGATTRPATTPPTTPPATGG